MARRFVGTLDDLKARLGGVPGDWREINENQQQFRHLNGAVLNWYPSTGTLNVQGKGSAKSDLENAVAAALGRSSEDIAEPSILPSLEISPAPSNPLPNPDNDSVGRYALLEKGFGNSELILGFVGSIGTDIEAVISIVEARLTAFRYQSNVIRVSRDVIPLLVPLPEAGLGEFDRISRSMDAGNEARRRCGDNSVLALGVAAKISHTYGDDIAQRSSQKRAALINSLKHPDEVARLRQIYPQGFYLIGVHADTKRRRRRLTDEKRMPGEQADLLMDRDEDEHIPHGQRTSDTFHLSDFFIRLDENHDKLQQDVWRLLDILFGSPHKTPTFDEYAMFMAFSASLRSSDLSRQVGAVITQHREIIATGANDCPKAGGGLYWPEYGTQTARIEDARDGRDYMRGVDSNKSEQLKIIEYIVSNSERFADREALRSVLMRSGISDITEYGRVVHAEMEALLSCARNNLSARDATLYCTTFPCHNCAKHIIAAGIKRVVYVEPYPKSRALEFHTDSVQLGFSDGHTKGGKVCFEPFVGVGPRRFFDLFSMRLGSGWPLKLKDEQGIAASCSPEASKLRIQMLPASYLEIEKLASTMFNETRVNLENGNGSR